MLHLISLDLWVVEGVAESTLVPAVVPKLFQNRASLTLVIEEMSTISMSLVLWVCISDRVRSQTDVAFIALCIIFRDDLGEVTNCYRGKRSQCPLSKHLYS